MHIHVYLHVDVDVLVFCVKCIDVIAMYNALTSLTVAELACDLIPIAIHLSGSDSVANEIIRSLYRIQRR